MGNTNFIVPVMKSIGSVPTNLWIFYVILNPNLEIDRYPLLRTEDTFAELQKGELYSKIDLFKAYNQLVLDEQS